ncbi:hypothetical protein LLB_1384 [Legionella longbeachae D-4968]|nr:hypothetical protein LLB_1384 [Legionella longbeachae D-4968]
MHGILPSSILAVTYNLISFFHEWGRFLKKNNSPTDQK